MGGLRERGVEWVATLCGHGLDPFFAAAHAGGLRLVDVRNEQTAGYVADVFGRLTGKPGVCAVSSGVAVANALTGVVNSWIDGAPMLLISGAADGSRLGMGAFQDLDHVALARPVTRWSQRLDSPVRVLHALDEAWRAASQRLPLPGPAHVMLPMDMQRAVVAEEDLVKPTPAEPVAMEGRRSGRSGRRAVASEAASDRGWVGSVLRWRGIGSTRVCRAERDSGGDADLGSRRVRHSVRVVPRRCRGGHRRCGSAGGCGLPGDGGCGARLSGGVLAAGFDASKDARDRVDARLESGRSGLCGGEGTAEDPVAADGAAKSGGVSKTGGPARTRAGTQGRCIRSTWYMPSRGYCRPTGCC